MAQATRVREIITDLNMNRKQLRCAHASTGRAPAHKQCSNNYDCGTCPFDQMLEDMNVAQTRSSEHRRAEARAA
jgi:hypothetical protein